MNSNSNDGQDLVQTIEKKIAALEIGPSDDNNNLVYDLIKHMWQYNQNVEKKVVALEKDLFRMSQTQTLSQDPIQLTVTQPVDDIESMRRQLNFRMPIHDIEALNEANDCLSNDGEQKKLFVSDVI